MTKPDMSEPDKIIMLYLRRIDEKLNMLANDLRDLKIHAFNIEEETSGINRRLDRLDIDKPLTAADAIGFNT